MKVTIQVRIDLGTLHSQIEDAVGDLGEVDGLGPDETSVYTIVSTGVSEMENPGEFEIEFEVERESGKFASKNDIGARLEDMVGDYEVTVPIEII